MKPIILHNFSEADIDRALDEVSRLTFSRYDNPFERKSFLEDKGQLLDSQFRALRYMLYQELCEYGTRRWFNRLLNIPIEQAEHRHYGGLFVYNPGDYLAPHVDAGIHPITGQRKVATALLYLTPAELSFWRGDVCTDPDPEVWLEEKIVVAPNTCVLFANDDFAWHSVPRVQGTRVVLTVSYMADGSFDHTRYRNTRTRAYFAKRHGVQDGLDHLRRLRASEEGHASVYRMEE